MGEPLGLALLMPALLLATRYRNSAHWRRDAIAIAVLIALALLSKEMLVVFVPFIVVIATCLAAPGRLEWPQMGQRTMYLVGCIVIATIVALAPVAVTAVHAPPGNYASQYGGWKMDPGQLLLNFATVVLPVTQSRPGEIVSLFTAPANALFLLTLAMIGVVIYRGQARTTHGLGSRGCLDWSRTLSAGVRRRRVRAVVILSGLLRPSIRARLRHAARRRGDRCHSGRPAPGASDAAACAGILLLGAVRAMLPAQESFARRTVQGDLARFLADRATSPPGSRHEGGFPALSVGTLAGHWTDARAIRRRPVPGRGAGAISRHDMCRSASAVRCQRSHRYRRIVHGRLRDVPASDHDFPCALSLPDTAPASDPARYSSHRCL